MQKQDRPPRICRMQAKGKCKFGEKCKFNHDILKIFVMRHGQSKYNLIVSETDDDFKSEEAIKLYQLNPEFVDSPLTDKTFQEQFLNIPPEFYMGGGSYEVDVIFVSPMRRTLETTQRLLDLQNLKAKKIIVMPGLTEVFSKICDISGPISEKSKEFSQFDFSRMLAKYPEEKVDQWQDQLLDEEHKQLIVPDKIGYERYKDILEKVFPNSMESYNRCLQRTLRCLGEIKKMSQEQHWEKVFIVSHNRILRYTVGVIGREPGAQPIRLANCQIKQAFI